MSDANVSTRIAGRHAHRSSVAALVVVVTLGVFGAARTSEAAGEVDWFNLLSENTYAAINFYEELLGWEIDQTGVGTFIAYRNGIPFAGINQIADRLPGESESLWVAALNVDEVAAAVAAARELNATIHEDVTHLPGWGTYALMQDPQGAPFLVVQPERTLGGTEGFSGWEWAELWTHDTAAAADFYTAVIGYELEEVSIDDATYSAFRHDDVRRAGLMELRNAETSPRWAPYVGVTDLRSVLVRVWDAGGQVLFEPAEIDFAIGGEDRIALIADPTGAMLFLHQLDEAASADPLIQAQQIGSTPDRRRSGSGSVDLDVSISIGYGFGSGWGPAYPLRPYGPFGPYVPGAPF